ncbi:hypothetical protein GQ55_4G102700 [Panicum hallii var. hallii]|uniref:Uncharacterized protein n=1 Tax=Panicum hallii var. hallii TaxID=1504633 RepID=A0A2T7DX84_9POAL|nr:hypothetical protein GQ55_4G102700 [Panicum hallii var. hallii]
MTDERHSMAEEGRAAAVGTNEAGLPAPLRTEKKAGAAPPPAPLPPRPTEKTPAQIRRLSGGILEDHRCVGGEGRRGRMPQLATALTRELISPEGRNVHAEEARWKRRYCGAVELLAM